MLLTARCVAEVLVGTLAIGVPVRWAVGRCRPLDERAWVEAPFVGIAAVVLPLQTLVYCHVPVQYSAPVLWAVAAVLWAGLCWKRQLGVSLRQLPRGLFATCLVLYLVHGLGLFLHGARHYVARGWTDVFNYTTMAEFLAHHDVHMPAREIGHRPYLWKGVELAYDRIGQSILHAFHAVSSGGTTRVTFEPTILLFPPLLLLAVYALARRWRLPAGHAFLCGLAAALLPGMTLLHLEGFLSHCLALPLLLVSLLALDVYQRTRDWGSAALAALLLAATANVYTEFLPILVGAPLLFLAGARPRGWGLVGTYLLLALAPFLLNPLFVPHLRHIIDRVDNRFLQGVYPWALEVEGIERIWFGDVVGAAPAWLHPVLRPAALGLLVLGVYGLIRGGLRCLTEPEEPGAEGAPSRGLALSLLGLLGLPFIMLARDAQHPYQVYKLVLTASPLFVLGLGLLAHRAGAALPAAAARLGRFVPLPLLGGIAAAGLAATVLMVLGVTDARAPERFRGRLLADPAVRDLTDYLERLHGRDIAYHQTDGVTSTGFYLNSWIAYHARHNRLWLANPFFNDGDDLSAIPELRAITDLGTLPPDALFLTRRRTVFLQPPGGFGRQRTLWQNRSYVLWSPRTADLAMIAHITNPYDLEPRDGTFFWMGRGLTRVDVLAARAGTVRLSARFHPGPSLPGASTRTLRVHADAGPDRDVVVGEGPDGFPVPVRAGVNHILLQVIEQPTLTCLPNGDRRSLLLGVRDLAVALEPEPAAEGDSEPAGAPPGSPR
jgi:hypothetical protein